MNVDRDNRLKALEIDDRVRSTLKECRPHIEKIIDDAIRESYEKILAYPEVQKVYAGMKMEDAVAAQRKHWLDDVFPAVYSEEQIRNGMELFGKRARQGLPLRWFFTFYMNMLRRMVEVVMPVYRRKPEKAQEVVEVLSRIVMFEVELAAAAYTEFAHEQLAEVVGKTASDFEAEVAGLVKGVTGSVDTVRRATAQMEHMAKDTAGEAGSAQTATQQTSANVATVASATNQLNASISEISQQVKKSAQVAQNAVEKADETNGLVRGLAETVGKIGDVVKLINSIASQTNLLALNATIEAARAGDAGKGFAVVAGEVKSLANQTAKATDEISAQISAVQSATHGAVKAIAEIGSVIGAINEISTTVASAIEEQGAATQEIARSVQCAAEGGEKLNDAITRVSQLAGQSGTTAQDLSGSVAQLSRQADQMSDQIARFLANIRAK